MNTHIQSPSQLQIIIKDVIMTSDKEALANYWFSHAPIKAGKLPTKQNSKTPNSCLFTTWVYSVGNWSRKHTYSIRRIAQNTEKQVYSMRRTAHNTEKHMYSIRRIAQSSNPANPTHPHGTQPASHPNMTNCDKLYGFPQGLGVTINSTVFEERTKQRKNTQIWQISTYIFEECV